MTDPTMTYDTDPSQLLAAAAELLHQTASAAWARAELEGPFGATYSLAHGIHLAASLAANLVPEEARALPPPEFTVSAGDTVAALTLAEHLISTVPIEALPPESSRLLVLLTELLRQARP